MLLSTGCMTVANHSPYFCADARVYGGVRGDFEVIGTLYDPIFRGEGRRGDLLGALLMTVPVCIDIPLCAIADTIWLRDDIRVQRERSIRAAKASILGSAAVLGTD